MPNIAAIDNGTMVESFKFLNYYQLATSSHVSKRFWNLILTHRHKLALLDFKEIFMNCYVGNQDPAIIVMFNEELSLAKYNEWVVRYGYSKQIPLEVQIAGKESTGNVCDVYEFRTDVYQGPNNCHNGTTVLCAQIELKNENWPVIQHFVRLLMDPFIYIRYIRIKESEFRRKYVFSLLDGAMNPDRDRLQCAQLNFHLNGKVQEFIVWIKDHMRCDEMLLDGYNNSNYDEEFLDLFMTGALCTSAINVKYYDLSKVIVNLVQEFMHFKSRDEYQVVESIQGCVDVQGVVKELKHNFAEFITEEGPYEECLGTRPIIGFINNDIEKKLTLNVRKFSYYCRSSFSIKIRDL